MKDRQVPISNQEMGELCGFPMLTKDPEMERKMNMGDSLCIDFSSSTILRNLQGSDIKGDKSGCWRVSPLI